jgi:hypothetical protein
MFANISQKRLLVYLCLLGLLPIVMAVMSFVSKQRELNVVKDTLSNVQQMALVREKKQALNISVRNHYRDADHFYLDKHVESMVFLEPEIESLQKIMSQNNFAEDDKIKKRLEYLTHENALAFAEGVVQSSPHFQEVIETQVHPVEINATDLQKVLAKIEGVEMGAFAPGPNRPQLLIIDFRLDKKKITEKNEVFLLNVKLLKREFL